MKIYLLIIVILIFCGGGIGQEQEKAIIPSKEKSAAKPSDEKPIPTLTADRYVPRIVYKDEWISFADSKIGTYYLNPSNLMLVYGTVYYQEKMIPLNPISFSRDKKLDGSEAAYLVTYRQVDCKKLLSKTRLLAYYGKNGGMIKLINTEGTSKNKMVRVKPNSIEKKSLVKACSYEL